MAAPNDEYEGVPLVQRTAERFARREFLKHGGKVTLSAALAGWLLGTRDFARAAGTQGQRTAAGGTPPGLLKDGTFSVDVVTNEVIPNHPPGTCLSGSYHCEQIGFGCDCVNAQCYRNGTPCDPRYGECPSGGYCWTECCRGLNITCCDYFCAGYKCHCCRQNSSC